ncbi:MAG: glycosyltransferase [Gemmatimonadales bacterium]
MRTERPLHILHLTAPAPFGGLETVVLSLAAGLRARGHRVTVSAATEEADHPFLTALRERSIPALRPPAGYRQEVAAIRRFAANEGVDILHSHGYRSDVLTFLAGRSPRRRLASTVHGFIPVGVKNRLYQWIQRRTLRRFDAIVAVSRPLYETLTRDGVPPSRLHCIPNVLLPDRPPLDRRSARRRLGLEEDAPVIGWVGRLSWEKGPDLALKALERIRQLPWTAVFLGEGPDQRALVTQASELGISDRVRWVGTIPRAGDLFAAFDVFLLSSRTEGTPAVLLEAMTAAVPIVATAVGGVPHLLEDGTAGGLVPPDDPEALARALGECLEDRDRAAMRAAKAKARLSRDGGSNGWVSLYEQVYYRLVGDR